MSVCEKRNVDYSKNSKEGIVYKDNNMGWVCDYCSTNNEDSNRECFVCGHKRDIKDKLIKKKEKDIFESVDIFVTEKSFNFAKKLFALSTAFIIICLITKTVLLISRYELDNVENYFIVIFGRIIDKSDYSNCGLLLNLSSIKYRINYNYSSITKHVICFIETVGLLVHNKFSF